MPIKPCKCPDGRPGFKWGTQHCYCYTAGDRGSRLKAYRQAERQARAIRATGYRDSYGRLGADVPKSLVFRLRKLYDKRQRRARLLIRAAVKRILGLRVDAIVENASKVTARQVYNALMRGMGTVTPAEKRELERIAEEAMHHAVMSSSVRLEQIYGRPVPEWWGMTAKDQEAALQSFLTWNEDLLKDVTQKYGEQIRDEIIQAAAGTVSEDDLASSLMRRFEVSESRANVIAHDQVTKVIRSVEHKRHVTLGFESYIWRSVGDDRVRPDHVAYEGQTFTYKNPPPDGRPGEAVNCRCYEEPVLGDDIELPPLPGPNFDNPPGGNATPWE